MLIAATEVFVAVGCAAVVFVIGVVVVVIAIVAEGNNPLVPVVDAAPLSVVTDVPKVVVIDRNDSVAASVFFD